MVSEFTGRALVAWIISPPIGPAIRKKLGVELLAFGLAHRYTTPSCKSHQ